MLSEARQSDRGDGDVVEFFPAGAAAVGAYHCADCGYGVTVHAALPVCPMCAGGSWERAPWRPFGPLS